MRTVSILPFTKEFKKTPGKLSFPGMSWTSEGILIVRGSNGTGKTTFLKQLREDQLVLVDGMKCDIALMDQMFSSYIYPYKPIWWNIMLPRIIKERIPNDEAMRLARDKLKEFDLNFDNIERLPSGRGGHNIGLSGGEMHLIVLLRTSLSSHKVLLLDEPTAGVDAENFSRAWKLIFELSENTDKIIIVVTHDDIQKSETRESIDFPGFGNKTIKIQRTLFMRCKDE